MSVKTRLHFFLILFLLLGFLVWGRLFYWQVWSSENLVTAAHLQHFFSLKIPAQRGRILASDGFPLAANQEAYLLYASLPELDQASSSLASLLAPCLATPAGELEKETVIKERLEKENLVWVPLAHQLDRKEKEKIECLDLAGLGFEKEAKRFYPEASSAAHLLGFVGADELGLPTGYFGLEGFYDLQLKGLPGEKTLEKDALGRPILTGGFGEIPSQDGRDLVLFLDRTVQLIVEEKLKWGIKKYGAKAGSAVVMDPRSGAILAMSSFPAYDPANFSQSEPGLYKNPVVADLFEPGSVIKPLVMAAALDEGVVEPQSRCDLCGAPREIGGYTISTFNDEYFPNSTMMEILERSDNVGMVFVAEKLGLEKLWDYLSAFGLGEKTGVDLQEEAFGELRAEKSWRQIDLATASFGQGIALTRLQLLRAFGALANGGRLLQPRVVKEIIAGGKTIKIKAEKGKQVIKSATAKVITEMLVSVTRESPLHFPLDRTPELKNYRIAAKSGTAQIPIGGHYDPKKTIASVIGFAPADEPQFLVMVNLTEPSTAPWGSDTAGPIFFEVLKELFFYYGIQP